MGNIAAPLLTAILRYTSQKVMPYHTPGHKQGKGMYEQLAEVIGHKALEMDLGLMYELDDLFEPQGCIKEAQDLAARLYGADHSFFVINGTTGGIHAMIMTAAGPGDKIIVPRNVHRSVIGGIIAAGAVPVYILPEVDTELGIAMGVTPEAVAAALAEHPEAKGLLLLNPTYYGVAAKLKQIVELAHSKGIPVIVDEAHGPHLKFSAELPMQAMDAGADICAQSTHKLLGALTQCSLVHCRKGLISVERLKAMLKLVQSTSPNYILLASLDAAQAQMAEKGRELIGRTVQLANLARQEINAIPGLYCFGREKLGQPGVYSLDVTKLTVTVKEMKLTGAEAEKILRSQYNIQAELVDMDNVLFLMTLGDDEASAGFLVKALNQLAKKHRNSAPARLQASPAGCFRLPEQAVTPREALFRQSGPVSLLEAAGLICAEVVAFYPPGIPLLCPGEIISREIIDYCREQIKAGLRVSGPADSKLETIRVLL